MVWFFYISSCNKICSTTTYTGTDVRTVVFNAHLENILNSQRSNRQRIRSALKVSSSVLNLSWVATNRNSEFSEPPPCPDSRPLPLLVPADVVHEFPIGSYNQTKGPAHVIIRFNSFGPTEVVLVITTTFRYRSRGNFCLDYFVG